MSLAMKAIYYSEYDIVSDRQAQTTVYQKCYSPKRWTLVLLHAVSQCVKLYYLSRHAA